MFDRVFLRRDRPRKEMKKRENKKAEQLFSLSTCSFMVQKTVFVYILKAIATERIY